MPWVFIAIMAVYGALCLVFAFRRPPQAVEHFFRVPGIFTFLPERWVMPAGRVFVALCCFALCIFLVVKLG